MKIAQQVPVYLLAIAFLVFGLNYFFNFIPAPPPVAGSVAANYFGILYSTKYLLVVKVLEVTIGILLFIKRAQPLALLLIAPIIVNIFLFDLLIAQQMKLGLILLILDAIAIYVNRHKYMSIVQA
jgi:putative oxidoreductase